MKSIRVLKNYRDENNNTITTSDEFDKEIAILFRGGKDNHLVVKAGANIVHLQVFFDCNNSYLEIGSCNVKNKGINASIRVGQDSQIIIGDDFTCTSRCMISAVEKSKIIIGNDCMIASGNEIKTDDSHPIFDVKTGKRVNFPKDIKIGNHVWLARRAVVLGGATIGDGSIIGYGAIAKGRVPNNCIAVGIPAKVTKRDVAWERPHLSLAQPFYKPDDDSIIKSKYWNLTID